MLHNQTPAQDGAYHPIRPAIRHRGPCGPRRPCWRPACREANGDYLTVEVLTTGWIAYCHGTTGPRNDPLLGQMVA
jgi:hypothetical protein